MENLVKPASQIKPCFWNGKRVLITGHSGFKGGWLSIWLNQLGASVYGISLPIVSEPNLFEEAKIIEVCEESYSCDIRNFESLELLVRKVNPEIVIHLAAQPLVLASYNDPIYTFETNVLGSINLLESIRKLTNVRVILMITTDKVYKTLTSPRPFFEEDALGGHDPYSASKACSEIAIASYRESFLKKHGVAVATARAGNVIGGGDWARDRLFPDAIRAWSSRKKLEIRNPKAIRPWQHVLEPLTGYLMLAEALWNNSELEGEYNFGPSLSDVATVRDILELVNSRLETMKVFFSKSGEGLFESEYLALDTSKAREKLGVTSVWDLQESVNRTITWYEQWHIDRNARSLCLSDIAAYQEKLLERDL